MDTNLQLSKHCNPRALDVNHLNNVFNKIKGKAGERVSREISIEANNLRKRTSSFLKFHNPQRKIRIKNLKPKVESEAVGSGESSGLKEYHHRRHRRWIQFRTQSIAAINGFPQKLRDGGKGKKLLETHVWHAKRMVMKEMFNGHVLPTRHKNHSYKHAKKALATNAIVFDASYFETIELSGPLDDIRSMLSCFLNEYDERLLPTNYSAIVLDSFKCEIDVHFHRKNAFPLGCLGPISLCFFGDETCQTEASRESTKVWLRGHPAIVQDILGELESAQAQTSDNSSEGIYSTVAITRLEYSPNRIVIRGRNARYLLLNLLEKLSTLTVGLSQSDLSGLSSLQDAINYLKRPNWIGGWQSGSIICCQIPDIRLVAPRGNLLNGDNQGNVQMSSTNRKPLHGAVKSKGTNMNGGDSAADSILWQSSERRQQLLHQRIGDIQVASLKHQVHVQSLGLKSLSRVDTSWVTSSSSSSSPTTKKQLINSLSAIPFIPIQLIRRKLCNSNSNSLREGEGSPDTQTRRHAQRMPQKHRSFYQGFDVVVPIGWTRSFLSYLTIAGAAPVGLTELEFLSRQAGELSFPRDYPETDAGRLYWTQRLAEEKTRQAKRPKGKRIVDMDLPAHSIALLSATMAEMFTPASVEDTANGDIDVIRKQEIMQDSSHHCEIVVARAREFTAAFDIHQSIQLVNSDAQIGDILGNDCSLSEEERVLPGTLIDPLPPLPFPTMITVRVQATGRGVVRDGASLYIPSEEMYRIWLYCHDNRTSQTIVGSRSHRLGEWRGFRCHTSKLHSSSRSSRSSRACTCSSSHADPISVPLAVSSWTVITHQSQGDVEINNTSVHVTLLPVGFVTSGVPCDMKMCENDLIAIALCDAGRLYEASRAVVNKRMIADAITVDGNRDDIVAQEVDCTARSSDLRSRLHELVLFKNPGSEWLRPAIVEII